MTDVERAGHVIRPRVLLINSTLHTGGAERIIASLAMRLSRERFDTAVCYLKENGVVGAELQGAGIEVAALPGRTDRSDRLTAFKLLRHLRERNIDVVHTHDLHGLADASICRLLMPRLRHIHTFHFGRYPQPERRYAFLERLFWRVPDALVSVGHAQCAALREAYRIPASRLRVLWNGVDAAQDTSVADEVRSAVAGAHGPIIGSISTLIEQKGLPHLIDAAAELKRRGRKFRLLIIGGGHLQNELEHRVATLGVADCVRLTGWIHEASRRALSACDIFVQSSLWEAMSVVVLEAMACGKSMVVTAVGENPRVVLDGVTGLLVPPAQPQALAAALERLIENEPLRERLGSAARARYLERFTTKQMISAYEDLYLDLCSRPRVEQVAAR